MPKTYKFRYEVTEHYEAVCDIPDGEDPLTYIQVHCFQWRDEDYKFSYQQVVDKETIEEITNES
jgi:hypothetical protein